jgi:hypothetical protein
MSRLVGTQRSQTTAWAVCDCNSVVSVTLRAEERIVEGHLRGNEMGDSMKAAFLVQALMLLSFVFDIPIARQLIGFVYCSFVPGILLVSLVGLDFENSSRAVLFTVALSLSYLMFVGIVSDQLYRVIGVTNPLSPGVLSITVFVTVAAFSAVMVFSRNLIYVTYGSRYSLLNTSCSWLRSIS